jgi:hypothetical protein
MGASSSSLAEIQSPSVATAYAKLAAQPPATASAPLTPAPSTTSSSSAASISSTAARASSDASGSNTRPDPPPVPIELRKINYDPKGEIKSKFNLLKTKLYDISLEENNDIHVARWNTYYYKKYKMESNVLTFIIIVCIIINILTFLHKTYPYFDRSAYLIMVGFILAITILLLFYAFIQIYSKDNMNFDESDYGTNDYSRIQNGSTQKGYVDVDLSFNDANCSLTNSDPKNLANSNFLKQLF